ncbi:MAG: group 1 truncated hemoglobin [Alphaproteobacteria bacterium]|nr:group 1 truncated hemoglobin [Alphaproteobacteria bacterium]
MADTIYQKIGGEAAVNAAVDMFYRKVLSDDHISGYLDNTDMDAQREKQKAFLTMVFGGPNEYTGKDLRTAHAKLVEQGMDDSHFDAVAGHLQDTLSELGVPADIAGEIMTVAAGTRSEVLNR